MTTTMTKPCEAVEINDELSLEDLFGPLPTDVEKPAENSKSVSEMMPKENPSRKVVTAVRP